MPLKPSKTLENPTSPTHPTSYGMSIVCSYGYNIFLVLEAVAAHKINFRYEQHKKWVNPKAWPLILNASVLLHTTLPVLYFALTKLWFGAVDDGPVDEASEYPE